MEAAFLRPFPVRYDPALVRTAVVTGAASGIGAACAAALAADGVAVAGLDLRPSVGCEVALVADVADREAVERELGRAERELGPLEIAVSAAGYYERRPLLEIGVDAWRRMLAVHVLGTVNVLRPVVRGMLARRRGRVCTIASELALVGEPQAAHYAAAKGAIVALSKSLALEAAPRGVQVNCVAPGPTDTPLLVAEERHPAYLATLPLGRLVDPAEVAATVRMLALDDHNLVGQVVSPNAGAVV